MQPIRRARYLAPALAVLAFYSVIAAVRGPIMSSDSSRYKDWAQALADSHFAYWHWAAGSFSMPPIPYAGWVTVVAGASALFGSSWRLALVALNVAVLFSATLVVLRDAWSGKYSPLAVPLTLGFIIVGTELWWWLPYVLTDCIFAALALVSFQLVCTGRSRLAVLVALLSLVFRPDGIALCAFVALSMVPWRRAVVLGCLAAIPLGVLLVYQPSLWLFPGLKGIILTASDSYHAGYVVMGRPGTSLPPPHTYPQYLLLALYRIGYYFVYWAPGYSARHLAANVVFYSALYAGVIVAAFRRLSVAYPGLLFALVFAIFHGLQELDFDWRYRLPCLLPLLCVAVAGYTRLPASQAAGGKSVLYPSEGPLRG